MVLFGTAISSLTEVEDLAPGFVADTLFGGLITVIREFPRFSARELMSDPSIKELQANVVNNSGIAEYLLEVFNSEKVIRGDMRLQDFIYYENYWLLMNFEAECIREYLGEEGFYGIRSIVFIGSGPLPLSSIELLPHLPDNTGTIVNYDLSEEAVRLGKALVDSQNLTHRISFVKSSVLEISELNSADVIYLAALVGESALEKRKITSHLLKIMRPGALLVARSAMGLRTFVYQRLKSQDFIGFQGFRQFDPTDKVIINSVAMVIKPLTTSVSV
jgi:nicotianamine synthase